MTDEDLKGVLVRQKTVYPPVTISLEAQRLLSSGASTIRAPWPEPDQIDDWYRLIDENEQMWERIFLEEMAGKDLPIKESLIGGVTCFSCTPPMTKLQNHDALYLFIHGGAFVNGAGPFARLSSARLASALGVQVISVDYRMPPGAPFPAGLHDCLAVYEALVAARGAGNLFVAGSSAGGNLAAALTLMLRDHGTALPAGLILLTPEVDLTEAGDSFQTNREADVILKGTLANPNALYAGGQDLTDPYLSPLFGDFSGFPPTFLQSGTRDLFLSNTVLMHRKLRAKAVAAELHVWEAMPHGSYGLGDAPEHGEINLEIARFIQNIVTSSRSADVASA